MTVRVRCAHCGHVDRYVVPQLMRLLTVVCLRCNRTGLGTVVEDAPVERRSEPEPIEPPPWGIWS